MATLAKINSILAIILFLCIKCHSSEVKNHLETHSIFYGLALTAANKNNPDNVCEKELTLLEKGIRNKERWALKMLDASGVPSTGLYWGNIFWLGSKKQCAYTVSTKEASVSKAMGPTTKETPDSIPPFPVDYYAAYFHHNSTLQVFMHLRNEMTITLGICIPTSCQESEVGTLLQEYFDSGVNYHQSLYDMSLKIEGVKKVADDYSWIFSTKFIVAVIFMGSFVLMCILGTSYDIFVLKALAQTEDIEDASLPPYCHSNDNGKANGLDSSLKERRTNGQRSVPQFEPVERYREHDTSKVKEISFWEKVLRCFSAIANIDEIFFSSSSNSLRPIDGLRFFTMIYIVFIHSMMFMSDQFDNQVGLHYLSETLIGQVYINAQYAPDTFFTISGFLMTHMFLKEMSKKPNGGSDEKFLAKLTSFLKKIIKRFLRLTPAYMAALVLTDITATWRYRDTAFWLGEKNQELCSKYWWRNLLYINNFYPRVDMCMFWSWYLSNDMQFFILCTALLFLATTHLKLFAGIVGSLFTASVIYSGYAAYSINYLPYYDMQNGTLDLLYTPPWMRIGPYLIGITAAYLLNLNGGKVTFSQFTIYALWVVSIILNLAPLFGVTDKDIGLTASVFYVALGKNSWSLGTAWAIVACVTNNGGLYQRFMSLKCWVPLAKISYCAYLLNPIVINAIATLNEKSWQLDIGNTGLFGLGFIGISFIAAFILSVLVEFPIIRMVKLLSEPEKKKPSRRARVEDKQIHSYVISETPLRTHI